MCESINEWILASDQSAARLCCTSIRILMRLSLFLHLECFHKYASTWRGKKSHFHYCENASISTMLSHCSGFYLEAEEKMKCIAVRIWHFEFDRESPMASFEETDAAASVQSTNRLLYTWSFEKIIQKNKVNTHQRFKLLMWCSHFLPDYSLRLLKFADLGLLGMGSVIWM